jgi:hypothetical protein
MLEAQDNELRAIRAGEPTTVGGFDRNLTTLTSLTRNNTQASVATFTSVDLNKLAATNDERLRRIRNQGAHALGGAGTGDPDDVLASFLRSSTERPVGLPSLDRDGGGALPLPNESEHIDYSRLGSDSDVGFA